MKKSDWDSIKHFDKSEFDCRHTGLNEMRLSHVIKINKLREICGFPIFVTSGYRHPTHPVEIKKAHPGEHSDGLATDVKVPKHHRHRLLLEAIKLFPRIGVSNDFIHLGSALEIDGFPSPRVWGY